MKFVLIINGLIFLSQSKIGLIPMNNFFAWQTDYIYFLYGGAFVALAAVSYVLMKNKSLVFVWKPKWKKTEEGLRRYQGHLEEMVKERTTELSEMNKRLQQEIAERRTAEEELRRHREHLSELVREQTSGLTAANKRLNHLNEALKNSEERFRSLFNLASDCILLMDAGSDQLLISDCNVAACVMNGYTRDELIGMPIAALSDEESRKKVPDLAGQIISGKACTFEVGHLRKDGSVFPVEVSAQLIHLSGRPYILAIDRDITRRKLAETMVRDSEQRYKNLVELTTDIIYISDENGNRSFMNEAAIEVLGYQKEEVIGKPFINLVHPDDRERTLQKWLEIKEKGIDVFNFENRYITKKGKAIDLLHNVKVVRNENGEIIGTQGIARDITQRKKTEENLALFSKAVEETMDGVLITDLNGYIVYSNRSIKEIYGYSAEELFGRHVNETNVDSFFAGEEIIPSIRKSGRWNGELVIRHKDGMEFPVWLTASVIKDNMGNPLAMVVVVRDITERRQAEEELKRHRENLLEMVEEKTSELKTAVQLLTSEINFRKMTEDTLKDSEAKYRNLSLEFHTLLDAIPDTLILLSRDLKVMWANRAVASVIGTESSDMVGRHCFEVWHGRFEPCEDCVALKSFSSGKNESFQHRTSSGKLFDSRAFPIRGEDGLVSSVIIVLTDITEKTALQAEAMRASHLASLGELAAGVAHEINNPINGIINYAQILTNKTAAGSKENEISQRIIKEGDRVAGIVRGLLSFARERREEKGPVPARRIIDDTITLTGAQIRKDGIELLVDIPDNLYEIVANPQQIQQVFLNVISNARYALNRKYPGTHPNKKLEISCSNVMIDDLNYVRVAFCDMGTGIPPDILDKVLHPFFSTKPSGLGTGLGLSISHGIIRSHGGKLRLESTDGAYTKVTIDLPAMESYG
ncbi:putative Histidine kinase [Candidatus Sulfobium mesophilum]|uniref:histidine kinase n=1 Tax=Candidatus Sulfobium mesophilum TaxID=2016548 RepID=A0A2U3QE08_9BACT|nr:putative Histidine kinase [Candidatus Sulfobium mesophilum]